MVVLEDEVLGTLQGVLDRELHVDDVLVVGEHEGFLRLLVLRVAAIAHFHGAHLRHVHELVGLDRIRQVPARAGHRRLEVFAQPQHHAAPAFVHDVEAAREPQGDDEQDDEDHPSAHGRVHVAARAGPGRRAGGTAAKTEQARDFLLQLSQDLIEIGRTFVVLLSPLGIVRRHREYFRPRWAGLGWRPGRSRPALREGLRYPHRWTHSP